MYKTAPEIRTPPLIRTFLVIPRLERFHCSTVGLMADFNTSLHIIQLVSLTFDGLTGVIQDSLKLKHDVRALHMMYAVNVISAGYLAVGMFLSGEGIEAVGFVQRHPDVILNILSFSLASAIGQVRFYSV